MLKEKNEKNEEKILKNVVRKSNSLDEEGTTTKNKGYCNCVLKIKIKQIKKTKKDREKETRVKYKIHKRKEMSHNQP